MEVWNSCIIRILCGGVWTCCVLSLTEWGVRWLLSSDSVEGCAIIAFWAFAVWRYEMDILLILCGRVWNYYILSIYRMVVWTVCVILILCGRVWDCCILSIYSRNVWNYCILLILSGGVGLSCILGIHSLWLWHTCILLLLCECGWDHYILRFTVWWYGMVAFFCCCVEDCGVIAFWGFAGWRHEVIVFLWSMAQECEFIAFCVFTVWKSQMVAFIWFGVEGCEFLRSVYLQYGHMKLTLWVYCRQQSALSWFSLMMILPGQKWLDCADHWGECLHLAIPLA